MEIDEMAEKGRGGRGGAEGVAREEEVNKKNHHNLTSAMTS